MAHPPFDLTVIVPVRNSLPVLPRLIEALRLQDLPGNFEFIFTDNASSDGTRAYLEGLPLPNVRILDVPEGTFSHSGTRMRAAEEAQLAAAIVEPDSMDAEPAVDPAVEPVVAEARIAAPEAMEAPLPAEKAAESVSELDRL